MSDRSLRPARDAVERMLEQAEPFFREAKARPGLVGVTARITLSLSAEMTRLIADEDDAGADRRDIYSAAARALVNAAGSAGATLLDGRDTLTGAVDILRDALAIAESRVGTAPQSLNTGMIWPRGGRA